MLTYRHLLIKYYLATVGAELVGDESFDNKEAPLDMRIHSLLWLWRENC